MYKTLLFCILLCMGGSLHAEDETLIHQQLRSVLTGIEDAINEQKYDELSQFFHKDLRVTTINQEIISSSDEIGEYFHRWFGPKGYLKTLQIKLEPDALTEFYGNNSFGIVRGHGDERYILADGRSFDMKTRWTATVIKESQGKWSILSLHIGTDFLDNPLLHVAEKSAIYLAGAGVLVGLLLGLIIAFLWRKRAYSKQ